MPDAVCPECGGSGWTLAIINYTYDESGPSWTRRAYAQRKEVHTMPDLPPCGHVVNYPQCGPCVAHQSGYPIAETQDGPGLSPEAAIKWLDGAIREHSERRDNGTITGGDVNQYNYHLGYVRGLDDGRRMLLAVLDHLHWKEGNFDEHEE